jgi:hypothetical protein
VSGRKRSDIGGRIQAFQEAAATGHVPGRPGHERTMDRILKAWGIDGHNSHTNVCSASARLGYALWSGYDRPSPYHANARFILLLSSHLEAGHYFNPHAQRIMEGKLAGAKLAVMDPAPTPPPGRLLDAHLSGQRVGRAAGHGKVPDRAWPTPLRRALTTWREYLADWHPGEATFARFVAFREHCKVTPVRRGREELRETIVPWRGHQPPGVPSPPTSGGHRQWPGAGRWRALQLLTVLTAWARWGRPHAWNKCCPLLGSKAARGMERSPVPGGLSHYEMSFLLPHFLKEGRGRLDTYFTRVYNPVWTNPDGMTWMEVLKDEALVGLHAALTPTWNETALFADYVLPMGLGGERHDIQSQETHSGRWVSFRQPVLRAARERLGEKLRFTYEANPGEVWEEDELWIELSWRIDPDGQMGIRRWFESPYRSGEKLRVDEYYRWIFENAVRGFPRRRRGEPRPSVHAPLRGLPHRADLRAPRAP